jgi:hypothetical protein
VLKISALLVILLAAGAASAQSPYTGPDFSGVYDCKGNDGHDGPYTGKATLALVRPQSTGEYAAYRFEVTVPEFGAYPGEAAAHGMEMAVHFANTDPKTKDFGIAIARFAIGTGGKWTFHNYYYEPEYKGGNYGIEDCTQR